ncbi:Nucleoside-diphosphate-sugar epimerase [Microvirga guangxiensis]|uniref:Nucleoside-diphosphate-sugar epimerase n=2 Tax=Microvirga guangxiensis TaxID=549386 RepID=A0A1G5CFT0_9HYPH|nr:Nucleoside-diphosphate-sugar epimerase [Microvirga guangxiensis]
MVTCSAPGMRVLVTGAGGFVGSWLLRALRSKLSSVDQVYALGHTNAVAIASTNESSVLCDLIDAEAISALIASIQPTCVVHLAGVTAVQDARRSPRRAWEVNLSGTMNVAEAVLRFAPRAKVIFAGTSEVYGGTFGWWDGPVDESAPLDPTNAYAASKAAADLMIGQMVREGLNAVRFRPFNHTGPGQSDTFVVPAFASQIARIEKGVQKPVIEVGNLDAERDFLDVRDVVAAYILALFQEVPNLYGKVFNLASGSPRRVGDILEELVSQATVPIQIRQDPARLRPSDTPVTTGDASAARGLLGWQPTIPWEVTVRDVMSYWRTSL